MKLTVIGSTSRIGRHVLARGQERGHQITAFTRRPHALEDPDELAAVVEGDARDPVTVRQAVTGADAVLVIINGGTRKEPHLYADCTRVIIRAMSEANVSRLIATSAYPIVATEPRVMLAVLRRLLATCYADVAEMEKAVSASGLAWTIVRLNRLTNAPAAGKVIVSRDLLGKAQPLSRADVAVALLDLIEDHTMARTAVNVGGA